MPRTCKSSDLVSSRRRRFRAVVESVLIVAVIPTRKHRQRRIDSSQQRPMTRKQSRHSFDDALHDEFYIVGPCASPHNASSLNCDDLIFSQPLPSPQAPCRELVDWLLPAASRNPWSRNISRALPAAIRDAADSSANSRGISLQTNFAFQFRKPVAREPVGSRPRTVRAT